MLRETILKQMKGSIKHIDYITYATNQYILFDFKYFSPFYNLDEHASYLKFFKITFENELSEIIELNLIYKNITYLNLECVTSDFFIKMIKHNINLFPSLNQHEITPNLEKIAVINDCDMLDYVENQTDEIIKIAIINNPYSLEYVNNITEEICEFAIEQSRIHKTKSYTTSLDSLIYIIPLKYTRLFKLMIEYDITLIKKNKDEWRTYDICLHVVTNDKYDKYDKNITPLINYVPKQHLTQELCEIAVKQNGLSFNYIPNHIEKTYEMYESAIKVNAVKFIDIPENFRTYEIKKLAVKNDGMNLTHIDEKTYELCKIAVKENGVAIKFVPDIPEFVELCIISIKKDWTNFIHIKQKFITSELLKPIIGANGVIIGVIGRDLVTYELCKIAVENNCLAVRFVPRKFLTPELCKIVFLKNQDLKVYFPTTIDVSLF